MFKRVLIAILFIFMMIPLPSFSAQTACFRDFNPLLDKALSALETRLNLIQEEYGLLPLLAFKVGEDPRPKTLEELLPLEDISARRQVNLIRRAQVVLAKNPFFAKMAEEANIVLQDPKSFVEFAKEFSEQIAQNEQKKSSFAVMVKWAEQWGWRGSIEIYEDHAFLPDSIGKKLLVRDMEMRGQHHGGDSHALQLAYLSWNFSKTYTSEQIMSFMVFLSTQDGSIIWNALVDRFAAGLVNMRSPGIFTETKILKAFGLE